MSSATLTSELRRVRELRIVAIAASLIAVWGVVNLFKKVAIFPVAPVWHGHNGAGSESRCCRCLVGCNRLTTSMENKHHSHTVKMVGIQCARRLLENRCYPTGAR